MDVVPLRLNPHFGGGFFKDYWWVILIVIIIVIIIVGAIIANNSSKSNTGLSVSLSKKVVDGEEVYVKVVNGEEVPLTDEDKNKLAVAETAAKDAISLTKKGTNVVLQQEPELSKSAMNQAMEASKSAMDKAMETSKSAMNQAMEAIKYVGKKPSE